MIFNEKQGLVFLIGATLFAFTALASGAETPGTCVSDEEARLLDAVNAYRVENGLAEVPWSKSLITVAQWHAWDAGANEPFADPCNLHSWSGARPDLWSGVCYTPDHANAGGMWFKPAEITNNIYTGYGYENAAWGFSSPEAALNGWKSSSGHNNVILNLAGWNQPYLTWRAMGVGVNSEENYYFLWFSTQTDPQGTMDICGAVEPEPEPIFVDGFE